LELAHAHPALYKFTSFKAVVLAKTLHNLSEESTGALFSNLEFKLNGKRIL